MKFKFASHLFIKRPAVVLNITGEVNNMHTFFNFITLYFLNFIALVFCQFILYEWLTEHVFKIRFPTVERPLTTIRQFKQHA